MMNAHDKFGRSQIKIQPYEFSAWFKIDIIVLKAALYTRELLNVPMYFTNGASGQVYHPHGDAVSPNATSHVKFSLHKWGIDHVASKDVDKKVYDTGVLCQALDWDAGADSLDELFEQYLLLSKSRLWNAIGVYPWWNRRGFHTDLRSEHHPSFNAHWFRTKAGNYMPMTWANWKAYVLYA
jgi:hypothetical protein